MSGCPASDASTLTRLSYGRESVRRLSAQSERDASLTAPLKEALKLQRPLPDDALRMVATVDKADEWVPAAPTT
jgi:hypothetical protein